MIEFRVRFFSGLPITADGPLREAGV